MQKVKGALTINICIYLWIVQAFIRGAFSSFAEPLSEGMKISYVVMQIVIACGCITCIIGLLLKKEWARIFTLFCNIVLVIIVSILPIAVNLVFLYYSKEGIRKLFFNSSLLLAIIASIVLIFLSAVLSGKHSKLYFKPEMEA
jgi:xanthine/uracil permease